MRHQNIVFHDVLKGVPWGEFDKSVESHRADKRVRSLSTKSQFVALLYGQLAGAVSLREIEAGLMSHERRLYHLGVKSIRRSTLADANASRPVQVFSELFSLLVTRVQSGIRRTLAGTTYLLDSTSLRLNDLSAKWARFSHNDCRAKVHTVFDPDANCPLYAVVTAAKVNDITPAKQMPIVAGATYVFDLGYYDYSFWANLDAKGCRIVTRFKSNTPLQLIEERSVVPGGAILCDQVGFLPFRQAQNRKNPFSDPVREVRVKIEGGSILRILSNDLDASAEEIAALYKRRWAIELFFRFVKQTLKIKSFLGTSENAIRIQIAVALIAFVLLRLAYATQTAVKSLLAFVRLVKVNLMHKRRIDRLLSSDPPQDSDPYQLLLQCL
jgi:Transposase DDE domain/Domain of unknown function (DUF4372)